MRRLVGTQVEPCFMHGFFPFYVIAETRRSLMVRQGWSKVPIDSHDKDHKITFTKESTVVFMLLPAG